jgi:hypothetical protein
MPELFVTRRCRPGPNEVEVVQDAFRVIVPPVEVT